MKQLKLKNILWGILVLAGLSFNACKSKPKTDTTDTTTVDTSTVITTPNDAPVVISPDDSLQMGLRDATKDFPGVQATVNNGEVTLTGTIDRDKLPTLMQSIHSLKPKKVNNNLTVNK
jgi:hypothetical protein